MTDHNNLTKRREPVLATETTPLQEEATSRNNSDSKMDAETKRVLIKIVLDVILLCCGMLKMCEKFHNHSSHSFLFNISLLVGFPVLMFFLFGGMLKTALKSVTFLC